MLLERIMSYYVEHGAHYFNVSKYRIACYCYHPVKFLNSTAISLKSAPKNACMSVCVCVWMCVLFCRCIHVLRL